MSVRRALPYLLALLLGVAAATAVGCGDRSNLVPGDAAAEIKDHANAAQQAVQAGDCAAADTAAKQAYARALKLPQTVDKRLRSRINAGARALITTAAKDCLAARTQTQATTTETQPPVTTQVPTVTTAPTVTTPPATQTATTPPSTDTTTTPAGTTSTPAQTGGTADGAPTP
jgi:hypothetical protein